jgi:hypothetical protein
VDDSAGGDVSVSTKLSPNRTPPQVDEDTEDFAALYHETPAIKRLCSHSSLTETERFYALDMELRITAEVRGVTRKKIPLKAFRSIYLSGFSTEARSKLAINSVQKIGIGDWGETEFWNRLRNVLSRQVRCIVELSQSSAKLLDRFFVTSSYSILAARHYPKWTRARRSLPSLISSSITVKSFLHGQM